MNTQKIVYPFTAIVGQDTMKKALILNVINTSLGGVLIKGEKGTAKSTAVRALVNLLPEREQVDGCVFSCDPMNNVHMCHKCLTKTDAEINRGKIVSKMRVVDLPVSATEDRVVGSLDIEHAIKHGEKKFEHGILASANRNILYVDEVNLLDDHIVDVLLDSAAMGVNTIEREGVSFSHPAKFILVGTMNPEEGDLRPQFLDRFGMVVDVAGEKDPVKRVEVIKRRLDFDDDNKAFSVKWENEESKLRNHIEEAKALLPFVTYDDEILKTAARITIAAGVDGHRADISMIKTAITIAAYNGRKKVTEDDILEATQLVLPHRMRRTPFDDTVFDIKKIKEICDKPVEYEKK